MNKMGIVHRDLKPDNLLFHHEDYNEIKIIDFGLSKNFYENGSKISLNTMAGTLAYLAPEVINRKKYNESCDY